MNNSGEMSGLDKDSEFDSEEEDLEFHLYQQLYFEPNSDITEADIKSRSAKEGQHDGKSVSETCDKQIAQLNGCQLNQKYMPVMKSLTPSHTLSTTASKVHEDPNPEIGNCIYVDTLEGAELTLTDFTIKLNTPNTRNHLGAQQTQLHDNTGHEVSVSDDVLPMKRNIVPLESVRERLSSTCSDGSIPGSVPLDILYCNLVTSDEEEDDIIKNRLIMKNIETNDQLRNIEKVKTKSNKRKRRKTSCSDEEAEDSRCDKLISAASKNIVSKGDVLELGEDSNSDFDVYIIPPTNPRNPEILTLESSSEGEVKAGSRDGTCAETKSNKYRKIEKPLSSAPTTRNKDGKSKGVYQVSRSGGKQDRNEGDSVTAESDSDSSDVDMPEATKGTNLTLNIAKSLSGWVKTITNDPETIKKKKNVARKPHNKSSRPSVDFTKGRPNTTRKPSCEKWTQSMANFYDSDVSDDFDVSQIHLQQSDSPGDWHLIAADYQISQRRRYYNAPERCKRCKQDGHTSNKCPRVPVCHLCSGTDHCSRGNCPENCCFKCGKEPHYFCPITDLARICNLCGFQGHHRSLCPDLWRRFHLTTNRLAVEAPTEHTTRPLGERYCYNCAKQGHYGHECPLRFQNRSYAQVPQSVVSYCCPVILDDGHFVVNIDGAPSAPPEANLTTLRIKSGDAGRIIGKKGAVVKSVIKESGAQVRVIQEGQPQVLLFGSSEARLKAQEMIEVLLRKGSNGDVGFVEHLNNNNNGTSDSTSLTSSISDSVPMAADNSDNSQNNSWCENFLTHLDRRKSYVLKEMKTLMKQLQLDSKKTKSLFTSIRKLKLFKLKRKSVPSTEPSKAVKRHLSIIAMKYVGSVKYGEGHEIFKKLKSLLRQVQTCRSSIVPENICAQIAETLEHLHEPSIEKLDQLLQYAEQCTHAYVKKTEKRNSKKLNMGLNKNVIPSESRNMNVTPSKKKKKKKIGATKKKLAKKAKNEYANKVRNEYGGEIRKRISTGKKKSKKKQ